MKNHRGFTAFRAVALAASAFMLAVAAVGCAQAPDDGSEQIGDVDVSEASDLETQGTCCDFGIVTCPATGHEWEYSVPGCDAYTRLQALSGCNSACNVACTDSGWQSYCG